MGIETPRRGAEHRPLAGVRVGPLTLTAQGRDREQPCRWCGKPLRDHDVACIAPRYRPTNAVDGQ
jgi:hypothetical protein